MSQSRPPISPPPPRPASDGVKKLLKSNRASDAQTPEPAQASEPAARPVPSGGKKQVTFYIGEADRARAKAAYKATNSQEGHDSWSDFVARALMKEVLNLEATYNNGKPFPGGNTNLTPGRRLSPS